MKLSYLSLFAAGMLCLSACQNEPFNPTSPEEIAKDINSAFDFNSHVTPTLTVHAGHKTFIRIYDADPEVNPDANPIVGITTDIDGNYTGKMEVGSVLYGKTLYAVSMNSDLKMSAQLTKNGVTFVDKSAKSRAAYTGSSHKDVCFELDDYYHKLLPSGRSDNRYDVEEQCKDINIHTTSTTEIAVSMVDYGDHFKNQLFYYYIPDDGRDVTQHYTPQQFYAKFVDQSVCQKFRAYPERKSNGDPLEWCYISNNKEGRDSNRRPPIESEQCEFGATINLNYYGEDYNGAATTEFPEGVTVGFFMRIWVYDNIFPKGQNVPMGYYLIFSDGVGSYYEDLQCPKRDTSWMPFTMDFKSHNTHNWTNARCIYDVKNPKSDFYHFAAFQADQSASWPANIQGAFSCPDHPDRTVSRIMYGIEDSLGYYSDSDFDDVMFLVTVEGRIKDNIPKFPVDVKVDRFEKYWYGTYCFEDLYPKQGDYDLNDVVVRYSFTVSFEKVTIKAGEGEEATTTTTYDVKKVSAAFTPYHNGAKYVNDFYISYVAPNGDVIGNRIVYPNNKMIGNRRVAGSASWRNFNDPEYPEAGIIETSGTELDANTAMFCRDFMNYLRAHTEILESDEIFNFTVNEGGININRGINPYIYCKDTDHQVHLTKFEYVQEQPSIAPESEYERLYVVKVYDDINKREKDRMPFAIDIASRSDYAPAPEKMPIYIAYPNFWEWADSKNRESTDWTDFPTKDYPWEDWGSIE